MNINVSLKHGPLEIEVEADSDEDYQKEILAIADFLEDNGDKLDVLNGVGHPQDISSSETNGGNAQAPLENFNEDGTSDDTSEVDSGVSDRFDSVHRRTGIEKDTLTRLFDIPESTAEDEEAIPAIFIDEFEEREEVFGSSRMERQARASLVLLYLWDECLGIEDVNSSDLSDALHMSGIDPTTKYNMYNALGGDADRYFSREEGGHTVKLTRQGRRAAVDEIEELREKL